MAEATILVCDVCGNPAERTVTIAGLPGGNRRKDLCNAHARELAAGTRRPRRGRKPRLVEVSAAA